MMSFGVPAAILSLLLSAIGVWTEKIWLLLVAAILFIPFSYYLSGSPDWAGLPIFLPVFLVGSALAMRKRSKLWAWLLLVPAFFALVWVGIQVLTYT